MENNNLCNYKESLLNLDDNLKKIENIKRTRDFILLNILAS